jgi:hypothetical protein
MSAEQNAAVPATEPAPVEAAPPRRRRLRRALKWTGIALGALVLLIVLLPTLLSTSVGQNAIRSWLRGNVEQKVEFGSLDLGWMSGVRVEGLKVADESGRALLEVPTVTVDASLFPMLFGKVHARRILVQDPVVYVAKGTDEERKKAKEPHAEKKDHEEKSAPSAFPDIEARVEIRNLTLVFRDAQGREARKGGIDFTGRFETRGGPTTFELNVPDGAGAGIRLAGEAKLFSRDGVMLEPAARAIDATLTIASVDASRNRDVLAVVLGGTDFAGTLDGKIEMHTQGGLASGSVDLRASHLGFGAAAAKAAERSGDDLTVAGAFETGGGRLRVKGWKVRADGLQLDADIDGTAESLDGAATLDADLARVAAKLRAIGVEFEGALEGRLAGTLKFTPSPSKGTGEFALTGFRVAGLVADRPPVSIDDARLRFEAVPGKDAFALTSLDVKLPAFTASMHGTRAADGTLDGEAQAKGDLGGLLERLRDLGSLPAAFSLSGDVDALVRVKGRPNALAVDLEHLLLTEKDVRIEASGTRGGDGALDFRASGSGDLGNLFGRAAAAGAGPAGLADVKGRFEFEATAKGPSSALVVDVPKLAVTGDIRLDARAHVAADGALDAEVTNLSGRVDHLLALARRSGFLDRDLALGGEIAMTAVVRGTRAKPEVPNATLKLTGGAVDVDVSGSIASSGAIAADAKLEADLAAVADLVQRAGFVEKRPPLSGRLEVRAHAAGTRDKLAVPEAHATVAGGPLDLDVKGRLGEDGVVAATATAAGDVDRLVALAQSSGWMKGAATTGCKLAFEAAAEGPRNAIAVPNARLTLSGPLTAEVTGRMDAQHAFAVQGKIDGAVQTLLDLAAAWSGEPAKRVDGTVAASFSAAGTPEKFEANVPSLALRAKGLAIDAAGSRKPDGNANGSVKIAGPVEDLLAVASAFGAAADTQATGRLDGVISGSLTGSKAEGALTLVATDLVVTKPEVGGAPFKEPRFAISVPSAKYDVDRRVLEPVAAKVELEGVVLDVTASKDGDVVSAAGRLTADERFSKNHAALLSGAAFRKVDGPFEFKGDVSKGRELAAGWTGGFTLTAEGVTAPHVNLATAKLPGKIAGGFVTVDPIEAVLNGGPVTGRATIGLVGDAPEHHLVLAGKDVELDEDLAPLVAHANPLFAIGEQGKTGGKASLDLDVTAKGFNAAKIKRTLTGQGNLGLSDAFVQSTNWIGELLEMAGQGSRFSIPKISMPFTVKDSKVVTSELPMEGGGMSLRIGGNAGLDGALDYLLRVKSTGGGGSLSKLAAKLDKDGYLPLRLSGTIAKPKLKLPDVKDALLDGLGGLLGGKKDEPAKPPEQPPKGKGKKKKPADTPPPSDPPKSGDPPPPPPPSDTPPKKEDPPPPPPPGEKEDPPPPPPPK